MSLLYAINALLCNLRGFKATVSLIAPDSLIYQ